MRKIFLALALVALLATAGLAVASPVREDQHNFFIAVLSGSQEVPAVNTPVRAIALFHLNRDGTELSYLILVSNLRNTVAAHIHVAAPGVNGPVVAFLFGPAAPGGGRARTLFAAGQITAAGLVGPLAGQPLSALVAEVRAGNTYANIHTNDGVAPTNTGPGDFPAGETRGQLH